MSEDEARPKTIKFDDPERPIFDESARAESEARSVDALPPMESPNIPMPVFEPEPAKAPEPEPSEDEMRRRAAQAIDGYRPLLPRRPTVAERIPYGLGHYLPSKLQVVAVVLLGAIVWVYQSWDRQVSYEDSERNLVLHASAVAAAFEDYDTFKVAEPYERFEKWKRLDGPVRYHYSYEPPGRSQPYLAVTTNIERSEQAARDLYRWRELNMQIDWRDHTEGAATMIDMDDVLSWGNDWYACVVEVNGEPIGNTFLGRSGRKVISITLRGKAIEDSYDFQEVLKPTLSSLAAHRP